MKRSISKQIIIALLVGFLFSVSLVLFLAYFFPLGDSLNRTFLSALAMPLFWCLASVYLCGQQPYWKKTIYLVATSVVLLGLVMGALLI